MNILGICILASVVILVTGAVYVTKMVMEAKAKIAALENSKGNRAVLLPLRLQAYERMALFLERIAPGSLVLRCWQPGMDLRLLQGVMTKTIRDEWEHNLSQQVYISSEAWRLIRQAKDEMMGVINSAAITIPEDADPTRLASAVFATTEENQRPTASALEFLKQEMREL